MSYDDAARTCESIESATGVAVRRDHMADVLALDPEFGGFASRLTGPDGGRGDVPVSESIIDRAARVRAEAEQTIARIESDDLVADSSQEEDIASW